jgi:hypothetical protein
MLCSKTLSILVLATTLSFLGCKKKEDAQGPTAAGTATKPADPGAPPPPAGPAGNAMFVSDDDYVNQSMAALDKMTAVFKAAGTNCDKLADDLTKFSADNDALFKAIEGYKKSHPDVQKKLEAASKEKMAAAEAAATPAANACKDNQKLADAMSKISGE